MRQRKHQKPEPSSKHSSASGAGAVDAAAAENALTQKRKGKLYMTGIVAATAVTYACVCVHLEKSLLRVYCF